MGDVANITRSRGPGYPVRVLVLVLSILGSPLALAQRDQRTDVILFKSGDRVTGEIKSMALGKLRVRTDSMGTVDIEWKDIERVTSNYEFEIELSDGKMLYGTIRPSSEYQFHDITGDASAITLEHMEIVRIAQLENRFWSRWYGSLDAGLSFAKANRLTTWNLGFKAAYRMPKYLTDIRMNSSFTTQEDTDDVDRHNFNFVFNRYFSSRWFVNFPATFQHNSEINLDLRASGGVGLGRQLIQSNRANLALVGGGIISRENFPDTPSVNSVEAMAALNMAFFTYDFPKLNWSIFLSAFPSLSDPGRLRLAFVSEFSYEFFRDFTWKLTFFDDYDSDPQTVGVDTNDYGIATSIGWLF